MKLKDLMAIGGKPGLFKFIAQSKNGIIVESLTDQKRIPAYANDKISALEDIAIFTDTDEVSLSEVFNKIFEKESGGKSISHKSSGEELKSYFAEILPEYDKDRVYTSDMKKVIAWYNQLHEMELLIQDDPEEEKEEGETEEKPEEDSSDPQEEQD